MPKLKDWFTTLKEQGKIQNADFDKFLEEAPDVEIPEIAVKTFEDNFLTLERAATHKSIHSKIKSETLNPVDNELAELMDYHLKEYLDPLAEAEFKKTDTNSYGKLKLLKKIIPDIIKKVKTTPTTDEDTKKKLKDLEARERDAVDKISSLEKQYNDGLKERDSKHENDISDIKLGYSLRDMTKKYKLADAYEKTRTDLERVFIEDIRKTHNLKLGEKDGLEHIYVYDEEGKPKYNGNSPVTIDSLLEAKFKPFLKQSDAEPPANPKQTTVDAPLKSKLRQGASTTVVQRT